MKYEVKILRNLCPRVAIRAKTISRFEKGSKASQGVEIRTRELAQLRIVGG